MMPQIGSQTPGNFLPHSTFVPTYKDATALAPNLAFSTPSPPPHAHDVVEYIMHRVYEEDEFQEFIGPLLE